MAQGTDSNGHRCRWLFRGLSIGLVHKDLISSGIQMETMIFLNLISINGSIFSNRSQERAVLIEKGDPIYLSKKFKSVLLS